MKTPEQRFEANMRALLASGDNGRTPLAGNIVLEVLRLALARLDSERADLAAAEQFEREQRESGSLPWAEGAF